MYGAILGDIIGSPYEFDMGNKSTDFPLFSPESQFTDDTVMTLAVSEGLIKGYKDPIKTEAEIIRSMQKWGKEYPFAGYGAMFYRWLNTPDPKPYGSFGNGSAMRVSAVGWIYDTLDEVEEYAEISARVTHDHPEGIKGAKAVAAAIFLARQGKSKDEIRSYIEDTYGYSFDRTCDDIRPTYHHVESCQETVPEAMTAFFEGGSFEEVIRLAVSLGGDCDTLTAIAGSIAKAFYPVPEELKLKADDMLDEPLKKVLYDFCDFIADKNR